jgi:hypothetical protein
MLTKDELFEWFGDIGQIIFDTYLASYNIQRITQPKNENEKQILSISFFELLYHQSRFIVFVQLCKVFDNSNLQKRNFFELFKRLRKDSYDDKLEDMLKNNKGSGQLISSKDDILETVNLLTGKIKTHKKLLKKVIYGRNKLYAHYDPNTKVPMVTDDELEILIKLSLYIFNELHFKLYGFRMGFDLTQDWKIDEILIVLSKFKQQEIDKHKH